jgi:hypothetical protein
MDDDIPALILFLPLSDDHRAGSAFCSRLTDVHQKASTPPPRRHGYRHGALRDSTPMAILKARGPLTVIGCIMMP